MLYESAESGVKKNADSHEKHFVVGLIKVKLAARQHRQQITTTNATNKFSKNI